MFEKALDKLTNQPTAKDKCIQETIVGVTMLTFEERKVIDRRLLEPRRLHANLAQT